MKREMFRCACCGRYLPRDPRVRNQRYCGQKKCQQARKNLWQRRKLETDPDYRAGKQESQQVWQSKNKGYWKKYRCDNFATSVLRNRQLQKVRDQRRLKPANQDNRVPTVDLAKKDALNVFCDDNSTLYLISPVAADLAKKDALMVKIVPITPR
jgi:hypothetical protein